MRRTSAALGCQPDVCTAGATQNVRPTSTCPPRTPICHAAAAHMLHDPLPPAVRLHPLHGCSAAPVLNRPPARLRGCCLVAVFPKLWGSDWRCPTGREKSEAECSESTASPASRAPRPSSCDIQGSRGGGASCGGLQAGAATPARVGAAIKGLPACRRRRAMKPQRPTWGPDDGACRSGCGAAQAAALQAAALPVSTGCGTSVCNWRSGGDGAGGDGDERARCGANRDQSSSLDICGARLRNQWHTRRGLLQPR
jgi:hypothetical protein